MKYIRKGATPRELTVWLKGQVINGERINSRYSDLEPSVKDLIEQKLLEEQGWLCCYTGISLTETDFHIEHLIPQSTSKAQNTYEDVDYKNMLAAYPKGACSFGAKVRRDKSLPVHPLHRSCEVKFDFDRDGHIAGKDDGAEKTIKILNLDSLMLDEMRKQAIDAVIAPDNKPRSEAQIKTIAERYCTMNKNGKYPNFCYVVAQVAQKQLGKIERERKRQKAIREQAKK